MSLVIHGDALLFGWERGKSPHPGPLPRAGEGEDPRFGRRTALTFPVLPPPQKN
jgi:hypothetical protein